MITLNVILDILAYEGSPTNDPADAEKIKNTVNETTVTSTTRYKLQVADSVTDQAVALPDPSSDYLVILTDRDISIKINGSTTALVLKTRANGKKTFVYYTKGPISALTVSNASGAVANIDILVANK